MSMIHRNKERREALFLAQASEKKVEKPVKTEAKTKAKKVKED